MAHASATDVSRLEILSQVIDDERGFYRLRVDKCVRYLEIQGTVYDEDTMCRPYLLLPALPRIPDGDWTFMHIDRNEAGELQCRFSSDPLPSMSTPERKDVVDLLSLKVTRQYMKPRIKEVSFKGRPAIAKFACWPWEISNMSNEAQAYQSINKRRRIRDPPLVPEVMAYLTENGRPVGLLLDKIEGETPHLEDLPACESAVKRLHEIGIIHGDINKYNLLIDRRSDTVRMVDLEHSEPWEQEASQLELASLSGALKSESRAGYCPPW